MRKLNGLELILSALTLAILIIATSMMWNIKADTDKLVHEVLQQNSCVLHNVPSN